MKKNKVSAVALSMIVLLCPHSISSEQKKINMSKSDIFVSTSKTTNLKKNSVPLTFPTSISKVFPDATLAQSVAERMNKNVTDIVTKKDLAGITGEFQCVPGDMANLSGIGYLTGITILNCCKNNVTEIPAEIGNLTNLEILDFCKAYGVKNIPPEIGKLQKLKYIRFNLTEIEYIPKEIGNLVNLKGLIVSTVNLHSIPNEIGNLKSLEILDIHSNDLPSIPESISNLTNLRELDISHSGLKKLPKDIGNLKKLKLLNLFNNKLISIPSSVGNMIELTDLNVFDNYDLDDNYEKYIPKKYNAKKEAIVGENCIITLPFSNTPNGSKITYDLKPEDEEGASYLGVFDLYYDYANIKPKILKNNKVILNSDLFKKPGSYVFRIVVKGEKSVPMFRVYKWSIHVK